MGFVGRVDGMGNSVSNVGGFGLCLLLRLLDVGSVAMDCLGNVVVHLVALLFELMVKLLTLGFEDRLLHLVSRLQGLFLRVQVSHHQGIDVFLLLVAMPVLVEVIQFVVMPMDLLLTLGMPGHLHALGLVVVLGAAIAVYLVDGHHLLGRSGRGGRGTERGRKGFDKLELTGRMRIMTIL